MTTFDGFLNPLKCIDIEGLPGQVSPAPTLAQILRYMVAHGCNATTDAMIQRYQEVVPLAQMLFIAPASVPIILDKLIWPLRHAISSYMLCNYLGVIAQSGYVAEMVAILWLEMANFQINGKPVTDQQLKKLYGCTFEKMGQERRVKVLDAYGLLDDGVKDAFDQVRSIRSKYLHLLSHPHDNILKDSRDAFGFAAKLLHSVLGLSVDKGRVTFSSLFSAWMDRNTPGITTQQGATAD